MRRFWKIASIVVVLYGALALGLLAVMRQPVVFGKVMSKLPEPVMMLFPFKQLWFIARAGHLRVGDPAPDFRLRTSDRKAGVQLSAFAGQKPVVLIFGSYT
jgi:4-hydroxybenzoate polyprenyltransferase